MSKSILPEQPKPDRRDYAYAIVKGAVSSVPIPFLPGIATEVLALIIAPPIEKRQEEWINKLVENLMELQEKVEGFSLEELSENETFVTATMQAVQIARRNHQQEKLTALRNAVLNTTLTNAPEEDLQAVFLNLVDTLTTWHLRVLTLFDNPTRWAEVNKKPFPKSWYMGGVDQVLGHAYPELAGQDDFFKKICKDLESYGLAGIPLGTMMTARGMIESRTTSIGRKFLEFISTPEILNES